MHQAAYLFFLIYFIYHVLVGVPGILSVNVTRKLAYKLYKLHLEDNLDLKYQYALKALGFYALYTALICFLGMTAQSDEMQSKLLFALGFLTLLRALGRTVSRDLIQKAFNLKSDRNIFHIALNTVMAVGMFYVAWHLASAS